MSKLVIGGVVAVVLALCAVMLYYGSIVKGLNSQLDDRQEEIATLNVKLKVVTVERDSISRLYFELLNAPIEIITGKAPAIKKGPIKEAPKDEVPIEVITELLLLSEPYDDAPYVFRYAEFDSSNEFADINVRYWLPPIERWEIDFTFYKRAPVVYELLYKYSLAIGVISSDVDALLIGQFTFNNYLLVGQYGHTFDGKPLWQLGIGVIYRFGHASKIRKN